MTRGVCPEARKPFELEATVTVAEIVAAQLPGASEAVLARTRVAISHRGQFQIIPQARTLNGAVDSFSPRSSQSHCFFPSSEARCGSNGEGSVAAK